MIEWLKILGIESYIILGIISLGGAVYKYQYKALDAALREAGHDRERVLRRLKRDRSFNFHYVVRLKKFLRALDVALGDSGRAADSLRSPFRGRLANREQACFATGWSFGRCLVFAVSYPFMVMFAVWVGWGYADEVGRAIGLTANWPDHQRWLKGALLVGLVVSIFTATRFFGLTRVIAIAGVCLAVLGNVLLDAHRPGYDPQASLIGVTIIVAVAVALARMGNHLGIDPSVVTVACIGAVAVGFACITTILVTGFPSLNVGTLAMVSIITSTVVATATFSYYFSTKGRIGTFWICYWPIALVGAYGGIAASSFWTNRPQVAVLIVMLAIVPLVNAPLDWISIGCTRALLRRGCEKDAPLLLTIGLIDFAIGVLLLFILCYALVFALLLVDLITVQANAAPIIDVRNRLTKLSQSPLDYDNFWIHATVIITQLPSLANLTVGATSLTTWVLPSYRLWILAKIPRLQDKGWQATRESIVRCLALHSSIGTILAAVIIWGAILLLQRLAPILMQFILECPISPKKIF